MACLGMVILTGDHLPTSARAPESAPAKQDVIAEIFSFDPSWAPAAAGVDNFQ